MEPKKTKFAGIPVPDDLKKSNFRSLYFSAFFVACLMAVPSVLQPAYLKEVINIPKDQAGLINTGLQNMSQIATLLLVGFFGILSDKIGRRILIVLGFACCAVFYVLFGYTKEISMFLGDTSVGGQVFVAYIIRFLIGIGLVLSFPQIMTMIADYTQPKDRGKAYALSGAVIGFGSMLVFGALVQVAKNTGLLSLFYMAGALGFTGILFAQFGTRDRLPKGKGPSFGFREIYQEVKKSIGLKMGYLIAAVARADIAIVATFIILWMVYKADAAGITPVEATARGGIVMMVTSLVTLFAYPVLGVLTDKIGRVSVTIVGLFLSGAGFLLMAATENPFSPIIFLYASLICIGFSAATLGGDTLTTDLAPKNMVGGIRGGLNTMQPIGILIFMQMGGLMFDKIGYWAPFALKGGVSLICALWVLMIRKRIIEPHKETINVKN